MVAIVSGNSLGLNLTSMGLLGAVGPTSTQPNDGVFGNATQGSSKETSYVNASTGNLVKHGFVEGSLPGLSPNSFRSVAARADGSASR